MLRVCFFFIFMFFGGVYLNCFGWGNLTAFFCKSKDFKAFLRCSCVHFFQFVCFAIVTIIIICMFSFDLFSFAKKKKSVFQNKACHSEVRKNEEGIHL